MLKPEKQNDQMLKDEIRDIVAAMHAAMAHSIPKPEEDNQTNE